MNVNLGNLDELRSNYIKKIVQPKDDFEENVRSGNIEVVYLSDSELVSKINSKDFRIHPKYPIIVNFNGTEIYDIRDNYRVLVNNRATAKKRRGCCIPGYGKKLLSRLVAESWYGRLLKENESTHHIDNNRVNDDYRNLQILTVKEHMELHKINDEKNKRKNFSSAGIVDYPKSKKYDENKKEIKRTIYNLNMLNKLKNKYKPIQQQNDNSMRITRTICDSELLYKLNSNEFALHPKYPIIISKDGRHIYDIRNNSKILPDKRKCYISMYKNIELVVLVAESWSNRLLGKDEKIYHRDGNFKNMSYKNLRIIKKR